MIIDIINNVAEVGQRPIANSQRNLVLLVESTLLEGVVEHLAAHDPRAASVLEEHAQILQGGRRARGVAAADLLAEPDGADGDDVASGEALDGPVDPLLQRVLTHEAEAVEIMQTVAAHGDLDVEEHAVIGLRGELGRGHVELVIEAVMVVVGLVKLAELVELTEVLAIEKMTMKLLLLLSFFFLFNLCLVDTTKGAKKKADKSLFVLFEIGHKERDESQDGETEEAEEKRGGQSAKHLPFFMFICSHEHVR